MPMSEGGLVRYSDEVQSRFVIRPGAVVVFGIAIIVAAVILHVLYG